MELTLYAKKDECANALIQFAFGSNDSSFCRDNAPSDTKTTPFKDLGYYALATVDTETFKVTPLKIKKIDIEHSYNFKTENKVTKGE